MNRTLIITLLASGILLSAGEPARTNLSVVCRSRSGALPVVLHASLGPVDSDLAVPAFLPFYDGFATLTVADDAGRATEWLPLNKMQARPECFGGAKVPTRGRTYAGESELLLNPGRYSLSAKYLSAGPFADCDGGQLQLWIGDAQSTPVEIEVRRWSGDDRRAFSWASGESKPAITLAMVRDLLEKMRFDRAYALEVMRRFPKSLASAYAFSAPLLAPPGVSANPAPWSADEAGARVAALREDKPGLGTCIHGGDDAPAPGAKAPCKRHEHASLREIETRAGEAAVDYYAGHPYGFNARLRLAELYIAARKDHRAVPLLREVVEQDEDPSRVIQAKGYLLGLGQ